MVGLDISVVILHYNDMGMTNAYIENLRALDWHDISCHFIIVDNASPDGSGIPLEAMYTDSKDTVVLCSEENLGFARGNNIGIQYANSHYGSDLIVVSNNDIIIEDHDFMQKLAAVYIREKPDVLGPDIFSTRKQIHQSPIRIHHVNEDELKNRIREIDQMLWKLRIIDKLKIYDLISYLKRLAKRFPSDAPHYDSIQEGVVLHGAFFVLSKGYLAVYPDGIYPGTFLYMEEDILNYRVRKSGLKCLYDPEMAVVHLDGVSSLKKMGNRCKKYIFELEQTKLSCVKMLTYMEKEHERAVLKSLC